MQKNQFIPAKNGLSEGGRLWSRELTFTACSCIISVQSDSLLRRRVTGWYNDRCNALCLAPANVRGSVEGVGVLVSLQLLDACADYAPIAMLIEFSDHRSRHSDGAPCVLISDGTARRSVGLCAVQKLTVLRFLSVALLRRNWQIFRRIPLRTAVQDL